MITGAIVYLVKVILFHGICYSVYWALFRKANHFFLNRAFLLSALALGFVAPLITLPAIVPPPELMIPELNITPGTFWEVESKSVPASQASHIDVNLVIDIIYLAGVLFLALRTLGSIGLIRRIKARGIEEPFSRPRVLRIKDSSSFSFINTIFLRDCESQLVFLHEKGHVTGKHWIDLIFTEIVCILFWIDPFVWLYRKSLKQQHEYLADDYVLKQGVPREDYLFCILNSLAGQEPIGPIHKFNSQSLKQRIIMMTQDRFLPHAKMLYIGIVPLLALLLFSFSGKKEHANPSDPAKVFVIDAAHGGSDAGSLTATGVSEKQIALRLATFVQEIGKQKGLNIHLTRTIDKDLSLQDRVTISTDLKADIFLSLHLGAEAQDSQGAKIYVSENNRRYTDSKRFAAILGQELDDIKELGDPKLHNSGAFVLSKNHAASMIVEVSNLSNRQSAGFITDPANQRNIAEKIVSALMKY